MGDADAPRWVFINNYSYFVGAASTFLSTVLTFPIYKTIFRQQIHTLSIRAATGQLRKEGIAFLYRGLTPPLMSKTVQGTILFGTQGSFQSLLSGGGKPRTVHCTLSGCLAGVLEAILLVPFERVQNILQDGRNNKRFPSAYSIMQEFQSYSKKQCLSCGIYRGFSIIVVRNALGNALYFSCKDPLRDLLSAEGIPKWAPSLFSGSLNGALISLVLYPLGVLVSNMQAAVGNRLPSTREVARTLWAQRGGRITLLYRGASLIVVRSCVTWGVTTAIHDALSNK
ncbi:solute carrier family 25 member 53 [Pelobates cultripes]|uniref:Solute carrier family 25 member 53 n=1 Tax=Pelobates cultripes TaxID=61616 RepID=A0AAD1T456_PELCU|nr:solute carrier family 25 member 53 [Pelobates cultripes]